MPPSFPRCPKVEELPASAYRRLTSRDIQVLKGVLVSEGSISLPRKLIASLMLERERLVSVAEAALLYLDRVDTPKGDESRRDVVNNREAALARARALLRHSVSQLDVPEKNYGQHNTGPRRGQSKAI